MGSAVSRRSLQEAASVGITGEGSVDTADESALTQQQHGNLEHDVSLLQLKPGNLIKSLLQGFQGFSDPGCALFARKFDHAAAQVVHTLASQYLSQTDANQTAAHRRMLELPVDQYMLDHPNHQQLLLDMLVL